MDKLFKMLARGEMPNFAQMLQVLNDVSDIDWDGVEASLLSAQATFEACRLTDTPICSHGSACPSC